MPIQVSAIAAAQHLSVFAQNAGFAGGNLVLGAPVTTRTF
jgi:hypothetical protein